MLRVGGSLGLVWNTRDSSVAYVKQLESLIDRHYPPDVPRQQSQAWRRIFESQALRSRGVAFTPLLSQTVATKQTVDEATLLDRVLSISVIARKSQQERDDIADEIRQLLRSHPQTARAVDSGQLFELPYVTDFHICRKLPPSNSRSAA